MHSGCRWCNMAVCTLTRCNPHLTQSTCVLIAATDIFTTSELYIFGGHMVCQVCWVLLGLPSQLAAITQWLYIIDRFWCPWLSTDNHLAPAISFQQERHKKWKEEVFLCGCEACSPAPGISIPVSEAWVLILAFFKLSIFVKLVVHYPASSRPAYCWWNLKMYFSWLFHTRAPPSTFYIIMRSCSWGYYQKWHGKGLLTSKEITSCWKH